MMFWAEIVKEFWKNFLQTIWIYEYPLFGWDFEF